MTTPSELRPAETISTDLIMKLRDIAAQRRRLEEEEDRILAELAGAAPGAGEATPDAPEDRIIDLSNLMTIPKAAEAWKCHPRTMRRVAADLGAIIKIGGKIYVDRKTFAQSINVQNCSKFSISKKQKKPHRQINKTGKNA